MKRVCVLVGGLDSAVLAASYASKKWDVHPLFIREGFRWEPSEQQSLVKFFKRLPFAHRVHRLEILQLPVKSLLSRHWSTHSRLKVPSADSPDTAVYLPGRNVGLLTLGGLYCALKDIPLLTIGVLKHNPFPDSRPIFFRHVESTIRFGTGKRFAIKTPLANMTKREVILLGRNWPIHLTLSCLAPQGLRHCGQCNKCRERRDGFRSAGVRDLTRYAFTR